MRSKTHTHICRHGGSTKQTHTRGHRRPHLNLAPSRGIYPACSVQTPVKKRDTFVPGVDYSRTDHTEGIPPPTPPQQDRSAHRPVRWWGWGGRDRVSKQLHAHLPLVPRPTSIGSPADGSHVRLHVCSTFRAVSHDQWTRLSEGGRLVHPGGDTRRVCSTVQHVLSPTNYLGTQGAI